MVATRLLTADDLVAMSPDDGHFELINGELHEVAAAGGRHGEIAFEFGRRAGNHVTDRSLGRLYSSDTGFVLFRNPDVVVMPDVAFVRGDRVPPEAERTGYMPVVPVLVVEVVSRWDTATDVAREVALYAEAMVPMTVLIHQEARTFTVYRPGRPTEHLAESDTFDGEDVLPRFQLVVGDVFR